MMSSYHVSSIRVHRIAPMDPMEFYGCNGSKRDMGLNFLLNARWFAAVQVGVLRPSTGEGWVGEMGRHGLSI